MNLDGWTWEENMVRPAVGLAMTFPGGGGGGAGRRRRRRTRRRRRPERGSARARHAPDAGARLRRQCRIARSDWNLEPFVPIIQKKQVFFIQAGTEHGDSRRDRLGRAPEHSTSSSGRARRRRSRRRQLLKAKNVPVILSNVLAMPAGEDTFHAANYQAAGELAKAGVTFAFSSGGYENVRLVPFQAAMSVAWGLSHDDAIKALTINAAKIFGADKVGRQPRGRQGREPRRRRRRSRWRSGRASATWSSPAATCRSRASTPNCSSATWVEAVTMRRPTRS